MRYHDRMDGAHDIGGLTGLGPVTPAAPDEPKFKHDWQRRVFGLTFAGLGNGVFSIDENRYAKECMHPADYLRSSYYETWLAANEVCFINAGTFTMADLQALTAAYRDGSAPPLAPSSAPEFMAGMKAAIAGGIPPRREVDRPPRFAVGDRVRTGNRPPLAHTRLPRYARCRPGVIERIQGAFIYPDAHAHGLGQQPCHVYAVRFAARDLFGETADARQSLVVDAWEPYLEPLD
ncbi:MAG: nitrile hydratase subunit beta [Gammaproteobacteria bacterium]|nr:nitrile hydratase subunit beta [Gammaproteobacteria bacterium]